MEIDKNLRRDKRFHMMGSPPIQFFGNSGELLVTVPVDLSARGIGLIFDRNFEPGTEIVMQGNGTYIAPISMRIIWIKPAGHDDSMTIYRAGLRAVNNINLEEIFRTLPGIQLETMN